MKKILFVCVLLIPLNVFAISDTAKSTILMDTDSGRILYQKNANEQRLIASTTKIMTSILTIENIDLNKVLTAKDEILRMYGSNIYIQYNEQMKVRDLLYGLMLRSGNDAAVVLANNVSKNEHEFVKLMNKKARLLEMNNTIFNNCHGLDEETQNYSTAYDMALLSKYAINNETYKMITGTKKWIVNSKNKTYIWYNRNKLLSTYQYAISGKTGYTPKAGRTLVTNASKDGLNLTIVTLNDNNEYVTHESLYDYAFNNYKKYLILDKSNFNVENYINKKIYIKESFFYPLKENELENIRIEIKLLKNKLKDNRIGKVDVLLDNNVIYSNNVYEKNSNKTINIIDKIKSFFHIKNKLIFK